MKVNCVIGDNDKIISASEDRTIKIWFLKNGSLIYSINGLIGSIKTLMAFDEEYLISCAYSGKITYWNLQTYTAISNNNVVSPVLSAAANDYVIIYTTGKAVYTMRNPLFYDKIAVTGPNELLKYEFIDYCDKLLKNNNPAYNSEMDN